VIVLVRHAEKASDAPDAVLSPVGHARARCLARVLGDLGITHVFSTEVARTRETVTPLATQLGLTPAAIPAADGKQWIDTLRGLAPGSIALVAGHSNTIPDLVAALDAGPVTVDHHEYDWMFVIALPGTGAPTLLRTHYCPAERAPS